MTMLAQDPGIPPGYPTPDYPTPDYPPPDYGQQGYGPDYGPPAYQPPDYGPQDYPAPGYGQQSYPTPDYPTPRYHLPPPALGPKPIPLPRVHTPSLFPLPPSVPPPAPPSSVPPPIPLPAVAPPALPNIDPWSGVWAAWDAVKGAGELLLSAVLWVLTVTQPWSGLALVVAACVWLIQRQRRAAALDQSAYTAHWLEITPPARMPAAAAEALARVLAATVAQQLPWHGLEPRLALEVIRTDDGPAVAGVWVPGVGIDLARVARAVSQAVPGARVSETAAGITETMRQGGHLAGRELRPESGPWTVLAEPSARRGLTRAIAGPDAEEPLRLVLEAVTGSASWAGLQVVITPGAQRRRAGPLDAFGGPGGVATGLARLLGWLLVSLAKLTGVILREAVKLAVEIIQTPMSPPSGSSSRSTSSTSSRSSSYGGGYPGPGSPKWERQVRAEDHVASSRAREEAAKRDSPHVHVTVRVAATQDSPERWSLPDEVASAYGLALPLGSLVPGRARRSFPRAWTRRERGRGFYATVSELAALWHLPVEPSRYRLPDAAARTRPGRPGVARLPRMPGHPTIYDPSGAGAGEDGASW